MKSSMKSWWPTVPFPLGTLLPDSHNVHSITGGPAQRPTRVFRPYSLCRSAILLDSFKAHNQGSEPPPATTRPGRPAHPALDRDFQRGLGALRGWLGGLQDQALVVQSMLCTTLAAATRLNISSHQIAPEPPACGPGAVG